MRLFLYAGILISLAACGTAATAQSQAQGNNPQNQVLQTTPIQAAATRAHQAPAWAATLSEDHKSFINQLLDHWSQKSGEVKRYKCDFIRYDYNSRFVNYRDPVTNQLSAASVKTGEIRFAAPDKASYETKQVFNFDKPPQQPGQAASYKEPPQDVDLREKWVCDGSAIYQVNWEKKEVTETEIPPEMRGKALVNSPLPFLFGASREDILNRFWVRMITPSGAENEYWLEAYPKKIEDARQYQKLELAISRDELFLPIVLHVYAPEYDEKKNVTSRLFEFKNRRVNNNLDGIRDFFGVFVKPRKPMGFKWVKLEGGLQPYQQFDVNSLQRPAQLPGQNPVR